MRAFVTGVHLGLLQTGYLLGIQRAISAAHETYALVLCAWLLGALVGLWTGMRPRLALLAGALAYAIAQAALAGVDFSGRSPLWWAPAIVVSGIYSGRYFTAAIAAGEATAAVFARETHGFLVGALAALAVAVVGGRQAMIVAPAATLGIVLALGVTARRRPA